MQEYLGVHGIDLDHCMHDVFHVVSKNVFHGFDCVIVCYTLRGKHLHGMMYMGNVIVWLLHRKKKHTHTHTHTHIYIYIHSHGKMYMGKVKC